MKYTNCLIMIVILSSTAMADSFTEFEKTLEYNVDQRAISSETANIINSQKPEEMKCYPVSTVKRWAKHKKVAPAPVEKVVEKKVVVEKEVIKDAPKNNLSLLGGRTETGLETSSTYPAFKTNTTGQFDAGLMYQRRLTDHWRASVIGTKNGSFYGGIGYDF